jgi:hypothetical protein
MKMSDIVNETTSAGDVGAVAAPVDIDTNILGQKKKKKTGKR